MAKNVSALATSTTESSPNPTSAIEPARTPLPMATIASTLFQPIVSAVSHQAQRRAPESATATGALTAQPHPSAQSTADGSRETVTARRYFRLAVAAIAGQST